MYKSMVFALLIAFSATTCISAERANPLLCEVCTLGLTAASNYLKNNATDAEVLNFLEQKVCALAGPLEATCQQVIGTYGPIIIADLTAKVDPATICKKIGLCSSLVAARKQASPITCEICTLAFTAAEKLIQNNATDAQILNFLENNFCKLLGPIEATCQQVIATYGPIIIADLAAKVDPATICKKVGFCSSSLATPRMSQLVTPRSLNCTICKLVMMEVQMQLKNNASEQQIIQFMEGKLCSLAGPLAPVCKLALETFGPTILADLANGVDPEKVCEFLQMCSAVSTQRRYIPHLPQQAPQPRENPIVCTVCQYVVEFLDTQLRSNKSEAAVVAALDQVCKIAPASLKQECNTLINQYGIYLVQLLTEFADPLKVCQAAKLC